MNGKPLAELRTEIELGMRVYPMPDGYCSVSLYDGMYVYSGCTDEVFPTWEELLASRGEYATHPIWTTFDVYEAGINKQHQAEAE